MRGISVPSETPVLAVAPDLLRHHLNCVFFFCNEIYLSENNYMVKINFYLYVYQEQHIRIPDPIPCLHKHKGLAYLQWFLLKERPYKSQASGNGSSHHEKLYDSDESIERISQLTGSHASFSSWPARSPTCLQIQSLSNLSEQEIELCRDLVAKHPFNFSAPYVLDHLCLVLYIIHM